MAFPWLAVAAIAAPLIMDLIKPKQGQPPGVGGSLTPPGASVGGGGGGGGSILRPLSGTPQNAALDMMRQSMPFLNTPQFGQNTPSGVPDYINQSSNLMGLLSMFGNRGGFGGGGGGGGGFSQIPGI